MRRQLSNTHESKDKNEDSNSNEGNHASGNLSTRTRPTAAAARASTAAATRASTAATRASTAAARASTDESDAGTDLLDGMVAALGLTNQVNKDIDKFCQNQEAAQQELRFTHVDEDGNPVMMVQNANRGYGASSRDPNYRDNVRSLIQGGRDKGYCAVANCEHAEMELLHKCDTCKRYVHVLCMMAKDLLVSEEIRSQSGCATSEGGCDIFQNRLVELTSLVLKTHTKITNFCASPAPHMRPHATYRHSTSHVLCLHVAFLKKIVIMSQSRESTVQ
jgi:hypothetical protein